VSFRQRAFIHAAFVLPAHVERHAVDKTLIIVPTDNERDSLEPMINRVRRSAPGAEILIVDDNSPDGTGAHADNLATADPSITVLHRAAKDGLGRAYLAGF